jgi:hypothetical protein
MARQKALPCAGVAIAPALGVGESARVIERGHLASFVLGAAGGVLEDPAAGEHPTSKLNRIGSSIRRVRLDVLRQQRKPGCGFPPHPRQIIADRLDPLLMQPVDPPRSLGFLDHEAGVPKQTQVSRDRWATDRQLVGELLNRPSAGTEQLDDRAAVGVPERVEWIAADAL